jgi:hypothetical protein
MGKNRTQSTLAFKLDTDPRWLPRVGLQIAATGRRQVYNKTASRQCHKRLRLHAARARMVIDGVDTASGPFKVGHQSSS